MKLKVIVFLGLVLVGTFVLAGAGQQSAEQLYKTGLYEEEVGGNLQRAIEIYQDILKRFPDNRGIAAKAQLHIGLCYDKLGASEAEKAFQKVLDNYPEQSEAVREAKEKLSLLLRSRALITTGDTELRLRQVWTGPETDTCGAVSPDGRYLSFVDWQTGDLAIRDMTSGKNRRLTNKGSWMQSDEFALFSKWSPDSRRIVYQWYSKEEVFELRIVNVEDATSRVIYRCQNKDDYVQPFDWSPDGRSILAGFYSAEAFTQLGLISVAEGSVKSLKTQFTTPKIWGFVFSPDGRYIAYDHSQEDKASADVAKKPMIDVWRYEKKDIFLLSADGKREAPLIEHPASDTVIDWTPGGEGLLFLSDRTGTEDVWFIPVAEGKPLGNPLLVKRGVGAIVPMSITSQGALFYGLVGGATDVYEVGIDPQTGKTLAPAKKAVLKDEGHNEYPDYSPDGKFLVYISSTSVQGRQYRQTLGIQSLETGRIRELTLDLVRFGFPRWAPDGRSISVEGIGKDGRQGIFRVDAQTGDVVPIVLPDKGTLIFSHRWSADGLALFYAAGQSDVTKPCSIFIHNFQTGQEEPLPGSPSNAHDIDISPDGKWLVLINRDLKRTIRIMPASDGAPRELCRFEGEDYFTITPAWSADGRYIYFSRPQKPSAGSGSPRAVLWDLYRVAVDGGEAHKLDVSMGEIRHLTVHPDRQRIAFSSLGTNPERSQVWVMENFLPKEK